MPLLPPMHALTLHGYVVFVGVNVTWETHFLHNNVDLLKLNL